MGYRIVNSEYFQPVSWSGGTTTELFIFPQTADYQKRNFQFRLSTANVENDKSVFTSLCGISRKLMVLAGSITLSHENHYSRQLHKFDADEFEGTWKTSAVGMCTDFNLMTTGKTTGDLRAVVIEKEQSVNFYTNEKCDWFFIYTYSGKISLKNNRKSIILKRGDLLILNKLTSQSFEIKGLKKSELVFTEIFL
jgi:uncharacterized protein